ncbi:MAG: hypothetical protein GY855_13470 [candidate division Zixibacteria bacterium]|nr:hypothetical protein [candidate division Zixibacteria bacterium]
MNDLRKKFIYLLFTFSLCYGIYFHFLSSDDTTSNKQAREVKNEETEIVTIDRTTTSKIPVPSIWGIDPLRAKTLSDATNIVNDKAQTGLQLSGISYYNNKTSFAIINNRVVKEGDNLKNWHVVSINNDCVMLISGEDVENLTLGDMF